MTALSQLITETKVARETEGMNPWAKSLVDTIYSGYNDVDKFRQKVSFAPSGLFYGSGDCPRRWVLAFMGCIHESKTTPQQLMRMKKGIADHSRIQEAMEKAGIVEEVEKELTYADPPIRAYVDAILKFMDELIVGEIKTTSLQNFEYRQKTNKISTYQLAQLLIYMYILDMIKGVIIYEATKADGEVMMHAIPVEMSAEYKEQIELILAWCREVWQAYQDGVMPVRGHREGSKICQGCPVEQACADAPRGTVKMKVLKYSL